MTPSAQKGSSKAKAVPVGYLTSRAWMGTRTGTPLGETLYLHAFAVVSSSRPRMMMATAAQHSVKTGGWLARQGMHSFASTVKRERTHCHLSHRSPAASSRPSDRPRADSKSLARRYLLFADHATAASVPTNCNHPLSLSPLHHHLSPPPPFAHRLLLLFQCLVVSPPARRGYCPASPEAVPSGGAAAARLVPATRVTTPALPATSLTLRNPPPFCFPAAAPQAPY